MNHCNLEIIERRALDRLCVRLNVYLLCYRNTSVSADCPPVVSFYLSGNDLYMDGDVLTAGDVLTCESNVESDDVTQIVWLGINGGIPFSYTTTGTNAITATLEQGEVCLTCIVTAEFQYCAQYDDDDDGGCTQYAVSTCSGYNEVCDSAYSKY